MLTIRTMAEMGPWMLDRIDVLTGRHERCQRCSTKIKYVWVMEKQTDPKDTWRIGSECGPTLEAVSQELWDSTTKPFKLSLRHLTTLERLAKWEHHLADMAPAGYQLGWAAAQRTALAAGLLPHQRRVMGSHVSQALTAWKISIRKHVAARQKAEAKSAEPLPTNAHH